MWIIMCGLFSTLWLQVVGGVKGIIESDELELFQISSFEPFQYLSDAFVLIFLIFLHLGSYLK